MKPAVGTSDEYYATKSGKLNIFFYKDWRFSVFGAEPGFYFLSFHLGPYCYIVTLGQLLAVGIDCHK